MMQHMLKQRLLCHRILVQERRAQLTGGHEHFVGEQKVAHAGICRENTINKEAEGARREEPQMCPPIPSFPLESNLMVSRRCSRIFSGVPDMTVYLHR